MGMFDEVHARCPNCGSTVEFQTKAGACILARYDAEQGVPPEIAVDLQWDFENCLECGTVIELIPTIPITQIPMKAVVKREGDYET